MQCLVCDIVPAHQINQSLDVFREVLGVDRDRLARIVGKLRGHDESKLANILPVCMGRKTFVLNELNFRWVGDGDCKFLREGVVVMLLYSREVLFDLLANSRRLRLNWRLVDHRGGCSGLPLE